MKKILIFFILFFILFSGCVNNNEDNEFITQTVAIGDHSEYILAVKNDGTVAAAGDNSYGQCNVEGWTDIISIVTSSNNTIGLKSDGTVVAVGENDSGQCNVEEWTDIINIATTGCVTFGLRNDGTVVACGSGRTLNDIEEKTKKWTNIIYIDCNSLNVFGVKKNRAVVAAGYDMFGTIIGLEEWTDIEYIVPGLYVTTGIKKDGSIIMTDGGEKAEKYFINKVLEWKDIIKVINDSAFCYYGLKNDGTVIKSWASWKEIDEWENIYDIYSNGNCVVGIKEDGSLLAVNYDNFAEILQWKDIKLSSMAREIKE